MAETKTVNLNVETNLGSLKSQLRQAQNEVNELSAKFGATSEQAIKAAKNAAELKDAIGDAKALTDAFNPDAKFKSLSSSLSGVASGFAAYQGAMGLAGVESKEMEEQLLKVQSAMALAEGLQGLGEARDSFKQLKAVAIDSFKGIKTAIGSTGIGLFVVALGTIYAYWDDIKGAISGVSEEQKKLTVQVRNDTILQQEKLDKLDSQSNILKLQGKSERDILKLKIAQTDEVIKRSEIELQNSIQTRKAQVIAEQRNKDILKTAIEFVSAPLFLVLRTVDQIGSFLGKKFTLTEDLKNWTANLVFDPKEVKDEGIAVEKEMRDNLDKLKNNRAGYLLQIKELDKEEVDSSKEKNSTIKEDKKSSDEKDRAEAEKHKQELIDNANALNEALAESDAARQKAKEDQAAADEKMRADGLEKIKEDARKQLEINKQLQEQKVQAVQNGLSTIGNLAELFAGKSRKQQKRAFDIQKAANIASATIDTYRAVSSAIASTPGGPIIKGFAGAAVLTAGLLNIKKIIATKFDSGGSTGGGGGSTPSSGGGGEGGGGNVIAPNFNIVGANGTNQLKQLQQAPVQAYVVSGEMSTQQSLDRNRLRNATL